MRNTMLDGAGERRGTPERRNHDIKSVSVIVPTFNEAPNIVALVNRLEATLVDYTVELIFVDDSTDDTPGVIRAVARASALTIIVLHRTEPDGGLSGAVVTGLKAATNQWCIVMDGDLQHPPELIPALLTSALGQDADVVVASRYVKGGSSSGLNGGFRALVSTGLTLLTRAMFPRRLRDCTDPMTGYFAINTSSVDLNGLRPRGFKILLEVLARNPLRVAEEPFVFAARHAGESKASVREGMRFLLQLAALRFGRLSAFAVIGTIGAVANLAIMAALQAVGVWYLVAAAVAALLTIMGNFLLQERFVFADLRGQGRGALARFAQSMAFNLSETAIRTTLLWVIVETTLVPSLIVQAVLIAVGFTLRFVFHSRVVYRAKSTTSISYDLDAAPSELVALPSGTDRQQHGKIG